MIARTIPLDRIDIGTNRRALSRPAVKGLAASIAEVGLLSPITVHPVGEAYELVAGRHRVEAARSLGWSEIDAILVDLGDIDRKLAEIDENLIRNELSDLERSEHLAERKRLYLLKHPETKRGGDRRSESARSNGNVFRSFAADTAEKVGVTERSIRQDVQIAESIPEDVRDAIRETPLAESKTDLLAVARLPEADQRAVVATVDLGDKVAVRQAVAGRRPATVPVAEPEPEIHTTEVQTTVEAFALAALSIFEPSECRKLIALIREGLQ